MTIEELASAAGLTAARRYLVDWDRMERQIGTRLPADYKEYVYWFGPGCFDYYLYICVPGVENSNTELAAHLATQRAHERRRAQIDRSAPLSPLFPEPDGWLPWGYTTASDVLYWKTSAKDPDDWTIIGRPGDSDNFAPFDGGFTDFLHAFVWDTVEMPFIAETDSEVPIAFEPLTGEWRGGAGERLQPYGRFEHE
ncbi:SMI1/KNR4 family protein [Streptomyces sp. SM11]|uniref:SMI1/KNR4 family protein n=1 Tax=Streptomyces sp. SM11 TaxID=565557 RepID=UPI000CD508C7|nr:SMI1/KNR4 family protein [Streptomyces sp. SM11]